LVEGGVWPPEMLIRSVAQPPMLHALGLDLPERRMSLLRPLLRAASVGLAVGDPRHLPPRLSGAPTVISSLRPSVQFSAFSFAEPGTARPRARHEISRPWARGTRSSRRGSNASKNPRRSRRGAASGRPRSSYDIENWLRDADTSTYPNTILKRASSIPSIGPGGAGRSRHRHPHRAQRFHQGPSLGPARRSGRAPFSPIGANHVESSKTIPRRWRSHVARCFRRIALVCRLGDVAARSVAALGGGGFPGKIDISRSASACSRCAPSDPPAPTHRAPRPLAATHSRLQDRDSA